MLRHTAGNTSQESAWWRQEQNEETTPQVSTVAAETRYDLPTVQDLIARAAQLQTEHQQTMSAAEIEGLAEEIGVEPAFVRLAMAERSTKLTHSVSQAAPARFSYFGSEPQLARWQQTLMYAAPVLYLTGIYLALSPSGTNGPGMILVVPLLLAAMQGLIMGGTRSGTKAGSLLVAGSTAGAVLAAVTQHHTTFRGEDYAIIAALIAGGAAAGAVGGSLATWRRHRQMRRQSSATTG